MTSALQRPMHSRVLQMLVLPAIAFLVYGAYAWRQYAASVAPWSAAEQAIIESLWLDRLPPLPNDPGNAVADLPRAAALGQMLFFDTRLSGNGEVSCATCHQPARRFTDGLRVARAIGESKRNTPSLVGLAYSPWLYWDGRKDSLWAQALAPLEDPAEHGGHRMRLVEPLRTDAHYRSEYFAVFGEWPEIGGSDIAADTMAAVDLDTAWQSLSRQAQERVASVFVNIGKLMAAYERRLMPSPARFDRYAEAVISNSEDADLVFNTDERVGLRLFIGKARCIECHNGPLFTNNEFHNTGLLPPSGSLPDEGRSRVLQELASDVFNCLGKFSDAGPDQCPELVYMRSGIELIGAMRTPSLRNLAGTAPYMHKGQMDSLAVVLEHYNRAPLALIGHSEVEPLALSKRELQQLEAFLLTLDAPIAGEGRWLQNPARPSE